MTSTICQNILNIEGQMETEQLNFRALIELTEAIEKANSMGLKTLKDNLVSIAENLSRQHLEDSKSLPFIASQEDQGQ
jgi:hypothetical protein